MRHIWVTDTNSVLTLFQGVKISNQIIIHSRPCREKTKKVKKFFGILKKVKVIKFI
jgi:hypothetical protein